MTKKELNKISQEINIISKRLSWLDSKNIIESQERRRLFSRWDFLDYQLDQALISVRKNTFRIVKNSSSASSLFTHNHLTSQLKKKKHYKPKRAKCNLYIVH